MVNSGDWQISEFLWFDTSKEKVQHNLLVLIVGENK